MFIIMLGSIGLDGQPWDIWALFDLLDHMTLIRRSDVID